MKNLETPGKTGRVGRYGQPRSQGLFPGLGAREKTLGTRLRYGYIIFPIQTLIITPLRNVMLMVTRELGLPVVSPLSLGFVYM